MEKESLILLTALVDRYGIGEVISGLSYICGDKGEKAAVVLEDTESAKYWMKLSQRIDLLQKFV